MLLGPFFTADLVTSSRRTRYFLWRIAYGLILLFTLWSNYEAVTFRREVSINMAASLAESFFSSFAYVQILAILAIAPAMAGGSIAQERERRTLEYLLATDLTTTEIVFGKLASRILQIGAAILTGLPIMFIAGLLGGIDPRRLLMVMLLSATTLLAVCCLAMAISTRAARAKDGVTRTYFALVALLLGPFLAMTVLYSLNLQVAGYWVGTLMAFNPLTTVSQMLIRGVPLRPWVTFSWTIGLHLGLSAVCILLVYTKVRNVESVGQPSGKRLTRSVPRHVSEDWPMLWKEIRLKRRITRWGIAARVLLFLLLAGYLLMVVPTAGSTGAAAMLEMLIVTLACFGLLSVAARAATAITGERERFAWDSLRLTLLTDREIVWAKFCGAVYSAWGMAIIIALLWMALLLAAPKLLLGAVLWAGAALILIAYAAALGVRYSIASKNSVRAMVWTLGTSLFIGGGYFFCCSPFMIGSGSGAEIVAAPAIPYLLMYPLFMRDDYGPREAVWTFTFVTGCAGYLAAALILFLASVTALDQGERE